jgi:hypothetical protein
MAYLRLLQLLARDVDIELDGHDEKEGNID